MTGAGGSRPHGPLFYILCILIVVLLGALWIHPLYERAVRGENDFMQLYAGAKLVRTPDLYHIEAHREIHRELWRTHYPGVYYTRLPFYALILSPLARLPYPAAYWVFQAFSFAIVGGFLYLYARIFRELAVLVCLSLPLLLNFANGQDAGIVAALAGFAMLAMRRGRDFEAGLLLSLGAIKIHLLVLVPVVLAARGKWKVLKGGAAGGAVLAALSFIGGGWGWLGGFLSMIGNPELHPGADQMPTFRTLVLNLTGSENRALELALGAAVTVLLVWLARRIESFDVVFALSLAGGLLVCFHAYVQDLCMLLAAFVILATAPASKPLKVVTLVAIMPPTALTLLSGEPWSSGVSLLILSILLTALVDAHASQSRASAGLETA